MLFYNFEGNSPNVDPALLPSSTSQQPTFYRQEKILSEDSLFQISVTPSKRGDQTVWPYKVRLTCGSTELGVKGNTKVGVKEIFLNSLISQKGKTSKITGRVFLMRKASGPKAKMVMEKSKYRSPFYILKFELSSRQLFNFYFE
ncbi:hypothetical protein Zmor_021634 [Zophobas morio]|uniref:Uncharacterized protein n=1 Tax=Zophobas morio TaxID=2755281 RepID=A0AA38I2Z9_9CUCU|nr:hypothetical protein Zmor_021634 [Zophobas morio]